MVSPAEKEEGGVVHVRNVCSAATGVRPVTVYSMKCAAVHLSAKDNKTRYRIRSFGTVLTKVSEE